MATKSVRTPILPVTELEHAEFCRVDDDLSARPLAQEMSANIRWQEIPEEYLYLEASDLDGRIANARRALGKQLIILGHHYQREEVIKYADLQGDSFKLSQHASEQTSAEYIVFCGVHFMAETADILSRPNQKVVLPNINAGCSMADMAPTEDVLDGWDDLTQSLGPNNIIPVTYMNSTAAIKALCGRNGGIVCTSSNADLMVDWALKQAPRVLFLPDEHLGRNTAVKLGIPLDETVVWNPFKPLGGLTPDQLHNAKLILWRGHCAVHTRFRISHIEAAHRLYPDVQVIVHPECTREVVEFADASGSTEQIIKAVNESPAGTVWAIGTEINLVHRLSRMNPDKTVFCLDPIVCPCSTMYRIHPAYLAWVLEQLIRGTVVNRIQVEDKTKAEAKLALERMLEVTGLRTKIWDKA